MVNETECITPSTPFQGERNEMHHEKQHKLMRSLSLALALTLTLTFALSLTLTINQNVSRETFGSQLP